MSTGFPINPPRARLTDTDGYVSQEWYRYFTKIQQAVGSSPSVTWQDGFLLASAPVDLPSFDEIGAPVTDTWMDLVARPSVAVGTATVSTVTGDVRKHTKTGKADIYRFIPSNGDEALDAFYSTFSAGALSGLIVARG